MLLHTHSQRPWGQKAITTLNFFIFLFLFVGIVQAEEGGALVDEFEQLKLKPHPHAKWWIINRGDENGRPMKWEAFCGDASCVEAERDASKTTFARMSLYPDATPSFYTLAELAEKRTGQAFGESARWRPTPGHPVIVECRIRFSQNFNQDGSGAIGTAGVWLWNSPIVDSDPNLRPVDAMGINWSVEGSAAPGLTTVLLDDTIPVVIAPVPPIDIHNWINFRMVWEVYPLTTLQRVSFWVNGDLVIVTPPFLPFDGLSVEIWHDNQKFTFVGVEFQNPPAVQYFDLDYFSVSQP